MLRFEHVSLSYGPQKILDDLSFEIQEGQMAVLIGPSGCGKTTTLKMINRLIEPSAGKIYINGENIIDFSDPVTDAQVATYFVRNASGAIGTAVNGTGLRYGAAGVQRR